MGLLILAMMEFHCNDDKVIATKVFELGLKSFPDKPDYVLHYLNFLIQINDEPSTPQSFYTLTLDARALFERTVSKLSPQAARPLFDRFYKYECEYGDTAAIRKLSKRIADLYPEESALTRFIHRHTLFGINPIAVYDLPPPLPPIDLQPPPNIVTPNDDDDATSVTSSRANSVHPSDLDDGRRKKKDRFGRQIRDGASPVPKPAKTKTIGKKELPGVILEFMASLQPAHMFDGATFHVDELVKLIRNANVPYPAGFAVNAKRARGDDDEGMVRGVKKYRDD